MTRTLQGGSSFRGGEVVEVSSRGEAGGTCCWSCYLQHQFVAMSANSNEIFGMIRVGFDLLS